MQGFTKETEMKAMFKMVSALLVTMLVLAAFPTMGVEAAHYRACDQAAFIRDVTVPDGSPFAPGETFTKTWRLQNTGTCTWTTSNYTLVYVADNDFGYGCFAIIKLYLKSNFYC